jgi:uncharacterized Tic20 family protein
LIDALTVSHMTEPASPSSEPNAAGTGGEPTVPAQPGSYPPPPPPPAYPPAGGYPPPGYAPAGPAVPPTGYASADDKTWALIAHFGGAAGMFIGGAALGWVLPLIALVSKGNQSPTVRAHAVAALNFQILWSIVGAIGYITLCLFIGFLILPVAWLMGVIFGIIAGVRANDGQLYKYPVSISMIK